MIFLDCTLRDGGYYNNWDFEPERAKELLKALNNAGVQIIEVGYKSPLSAQKYFGLFRYCNEDYLDFLSKDDPAEYAFMIDVKQFLNEGRLKEEALDEVIRPVSDSCFTWVRLASHYATIQSVPEMADYFRKKGYKVGFNLMGGSLLSREQIKEGLEVATKADVDVFYLADSFGSFYPDDIRELVRFVKKNYNGTMGIHTHDNQGMAYANTLAALDEGVEFVDGTVTGMGRGAGNLQTEQFLIGYADRFRDGRYNGNALLSVIEDYIQPMKDRFQWGYHPTYMYSGLQNIHPTYCQNLIESKRYTIEEISGILAQISHEERSKYNADSLEKAVKKLLVRETEEVRSEAIRKFDLQSMNGDTAILVARGDEAEKHIGNIKALSSREKAALIECNDTGFFQNQDQRTVVILNQLRLNTWMNKADDNDKVKLVSGFPVDMGERSGGYYPFRIGDFDLSGEKISIPDYDAGLYAIGLALKAGVRNLYLAGFDGFKDETLNRVKEMFLKQIANYADTQDIRITHITPSKYKVFAEGSLYEL